MSISQKKNTLVIVESPAKAKTIEKYLGDGYIVRASIGHVRDLPKSNKKAIDISAGFVPKYEVHPEKKKVLAELSSLVKKTGRVLLATDPDREGEAIAWHLADELHLDSPERIVFHEITKNAIQEAIQHPRPIDMHLKTAQEARRVLDRLVGYDLSGIIWKKVRYGLSAGRVQSPALRIIMEREREIRAFIPEKFWRISADLSHKGEPFSFSCTEEPRNESRAVYITKTGEGAKEWFVSDVKSTEASRSPKAPFTTSTLQQAASTRLGYAPSRTMQIAQKLYEAGAITYMRTDSTNLSKEAVGTIAHYIEEQFGKPYVHIRTYKSKSKNAQEAHEAIRPTSIRNLRAGTTLEQQKLYQLIWSRTVCSQMEDAKILRTKVSAKAIPDTEFPDFHLHGAQTVFPGWLAVDADADGADTVLPAFSTGDRLVFVSINSEERYTEPPSRYSEAGLVKELEKRDIGRPSTYASIIKTLIDRGYVEKEQKALKPTDTGDVVSTFLENHFARYISDTFTAEMEQELDDIANGDRTYVPVLNEFYRVFHEAVKAKEHIDKVTKLGDADDSIRCPKCDATMVIKLSRTGKFLSCSKFPDCDGARLEDGTLIEGPRPTGETCPKCEKGELVERSGRFGKFIACASYPKCKYIKNDPTLNPMRSSGVRCPHCNAGDMIERKGRFGIFWSCSNYPDCKHAIKTKPTGNMCVICGSLMMEGTKTIPERCSVKTCPNHNPHKLDTGTRKKK